MIVSIYVRRNEAGSILRPFERCLMISPGSQPATGCRFSARPSMASHEERAFSLFKPDLRENADGATNVLRK
jgi:hypothetical protein